MMKKRITRGPVRLLFVQTQAEMAGALHRAKPDRDNIDKAILDALFTDDSGIAAGHLEKRWDDGGGPRLEIIFAISAPPALTPNDC